MRLLLIFTLLITTSLAETILWKNALKQKDSFYTSPEALRISENLYLYQLNNGGWPKNKDLAQPLSKKERQNILQSKDKIANATIDNKATSTPLRYLTKVWPHQPSPELKTSILQGLNFLLKSQYQNGGWPQRPASKGYSLHITYNDNAMINVMTYLRDLLKENPTFLTDPLRQQIQTALDRGLTCILNTQIKIDGTPTLWCAQHHFETLAPVKARSYEHPSISGAESVGIVRYLLSLENPSPETISSINAAITSFKKLQLTNIRVEKQTHPDLPEGRDTIVIPDPKADPIWARFYSLETQRPIFSGRDGVIKNTLAEIEHERRTGYSWYTTSPRSLLTKDYPKWQARQ